MFGVLSRRIQTGLLETKDLKLDTGVEIATSLELAEKDARHIGGETSVNRVYKKEGKTVQKPTSITTNSNHKFTNHSRTNKNSNFSNKNKFTGNKDITCYRCGKQHLATNCSLDPSVKCRVWNCGTPCMRRNRLNQVDQILQIREEDSQYRDKYITKLQVEGKDITFEVDSGSAVTLIGKNLFDKLLPFQKRQLS